MIYIFQRKNIERQCLFSKKYIRYELYHNRENYSEACKYHFARVNFQKGNKFIHLAQTIIMAR